ncbi:DNA-3-methyladenine glycosylase family protein [Phaeovulum vinaykumarii]|uniref:DNA-3-methyladenine glycosylase II n=1 Tax=Phaeovulum vinaykumarii TaxID=407234 RepID=A0A1N7M3G7_9RHOB|nr:DNA-3-methyladenine glycosylase [Phaeovulum vinaykumarii]SIS80627.1 DNA-3-methyladenine glycosylase II [Phaeovulum vinaykumarii]SOC09085.1 DNA-3-methyladenine glycosylase II [Phaeovulum vinaykumarii]
MPGRIIETEDDIAEGSAALVAAEPRFGTVLAAGPLPLRRIEDGFGALRDAVVGQQVSVAAARAIRARLAEAGLADEATLATADPEALRACGLSRQKIRYLTGIASARLDYPALRRLPDDEVRRTLVALPGIGRWTAEMYLIFALGRADVFAPDDLALAEAARMLFDLPERPKTRAFDAMAAAWSPWRAVAARALWAYYAQRRNREGVG